MNRTDLRPFLGSVGLDDPYAIMNCFLATKKGLGRLLDNENRVNTDDRPYNQFFPLSVSGFERLKWHVENLRQLAGCREKSALFSDKAGDDNDHSS